MNNPENPYLSKADTVPPAPVDPSESLGIKAEHLVAGYFNSAFDGQITVHHSTPSEDSGVRQIVQGKQIDAVAYDDKGKPVMCMQITTARNPEVRREKLRQLMDHPFVRLDEMTAQDKAIPKVLVNIDPLEADSILKDNDFSKHPEGVRQILDSTIQSLLFVLTKTQIKEEQEKIKALIDIFKTKKGEPHKN